jgi:hypothetical protein
MARPILDQWSIVIIQQVHVIIGGHGCRGVDLLLHPPLVRITSQMVLKYSSLSFPTTSFLIFYALIH